jgi:hypothetical protein
MHSVLLMLLLLVAACGLLSPTDPYVMTGTWTVQNALGVSNGEEPGSTCAGSTTWTIVDESVRITGTSSGTLCGLDLNGKAIFDREQAALTVSKGCLRWTGSMTSAIAANGVLTAACGNWGGGGTWDATRK